MYSTYPGYYRYNYFGSILQHFDFYDLQKSTEYDGGFTVDSPTIK